VNAGNATYIRSVELGSLTEGKIGQYGPGVVGLLFQPESAPGELPGAGSFNQVMALPFNYTFGTDPVRLTLRARQGQPRWNNFVFGFTNTFGGMSDWLLLQTPSSLANTSLQLFHRGAQYSRTQSPAISAGSFRTFVLEYDPLKTNAVGVNPYSLSVDGVSVALAGTNLPTIGSIGGIGWGFFFADGGIDRSVLIESMRFEILDSPDLAGDFNEDGNVDAADYATWRKNVGSTGSYELWRQNFGTTFSGMAPRDGENAGESANVPEPANCLLTLPIFLHGICLLASNRRSLPPRLEVHNSACRQ
jgi:hypothetical protein